MSERDREQAKQWDDIIVSIAQFADDRITIGCLRRDLKKFAEAYAASLRERNAQLERQLNGRDCDICGNELPPDKPEKWRSCAECYEKLERECEGLRERAGSAEAEIYELENELIKLRGAQKGGVTDGTSKS